MMRRLIAPFIVLLALGSCAASWMQFNSVPPDGGQPETVTGLLRVPDGGGRHPAVVLLPDCDGVGPLEPETINGTDDEDGCPDKSEGPVQIEHGKITAPPVFFATGKDVILPLSHPILKLVAKTFQDNPWVKKVRVEGHTDSVGSDATNLDLSKRRAASVMKFLIERGVDPARLESEGYGETRPVDTNDTEDGRSRNRRVDFIIIDPPQDSDNDAD